MATDLGKSLLSDVAPVPPETKITTSKLATPQGILEGDYHIKFGKKALNISKKTVWGTVGAAIIFTTINLAITKFIKRV